MKMTKLQDELKLEKTKTSDRSGQETASSTKLEKLNEIIKEREEKILKIEKQNKYLDHKNQELEKQLEEKGKTNFDEKKLQQQLRNQVK
jgi:hypothetical protein